jgi:hypothetical protein
VKRKLKKKKVIIIDAGKNDGVAKKSQVCFYNNDGGEIGCGKVRRVKKTKAYVRVKSSVFRKIKKGFAAEFEGGSSSGSGGAMLAVRGFLGGSYLHHGNANAPVYDKENAGGGSSYWVSGDEYGMGMFIGAEVDYLPLNIVAGFRYFVLNPSVLVPMDYSDSKNPYIELNQSISSSMGFWADYLYPINMGSMSLNVGAGLDIDMTDIMSEAFLVSEEDTSLNTPLIQATSSLMTIGLRIPARLDYSLGSMTINLGGIFTYGISGTPEIVHGIETEDSNSTDSELYNTHFNESLNHTPGMGLMGYLGAHIAL